MKRTNITAETFLPAFGLRNTHAQSLINSSGYRRQIVSRRARALLAAEQEWVVDGGNGVRLLGHYSPQAGDSKGLAILFMAGRAAVAPTTWSALVAACMSRALMFFGSIFEIMAIRTI